jgi:TonB family protein
VTSATPLAEAERRRLEIDQAEGWLRGDPAQRRVVMRALAAALVLHATILVAKMPSWGPNPVRADAPQAQAMKIQFLRPPPAPPKTAPQPPEPVKKKIARPDTTPDDLEPIKPAPSPPVLSPSTAPPSPVPAQDMGPIRMSPGHGPGLIKKVEPRYPDIARAARIEGDVVVDAVILKDGTVSNVTVLRSTSKMFEQACVDAVRQWRFTPSPQDVVLSVTVHFTLH